ncbi:MAG: hypothetical protein ACFB2Z_11115 [Maricaulaceae bacterium]
MRFDKLFGMNRNTGAPANDNTYVTLVRDPLSRREMSARMRAVLDDLSTEGVANMALVEVLFGFICEYASAPAPQDDPTGAQAMGRYNQLSALSGALEGLRYEAHQVWMARLSRFD